MLQDLEIIPAVAQSRTELIQWINAKTPSTAPNGNSVPPIRKVEQLCSGVNYVLVLATVLPVTYAPLSSATRVKVPANHEFESVANYKLMQDALHRNGVVKPDVLVNDQAKLLKANFQANLSLLQWFKGFCDALEESGLEPGQGRRQQGESLREDNTEMSDSLRAPNSLSASRKKEEKKEEKKSPAVPPIRPPRSGTPNSRVRSSSATSGRPGSARVGTRGRAEESATTRPSTAATRTRSSGGPTRVPRATTSTSTATRPSGNRPLTRAHSATVGGRGSSPVMAASTAPKTDRSEEVARLRLEKQFYYDKLRMIENLVIPVATKEGVTAEEMQWVSLARSVRDILYAQN